MAERRVIATRKDEFGYITHVRFDTADAPGLLPVPEVILDLELGDHSYYVELPDQRAEVRNVHAAGGTYLRADWDPRPHNNLLDLPDC
ncbi:hypothetical protein BH09ACT6_BH09ACT6_08640 [soil metagenome]